MKREQITLVRDGKFAYQHQSQWMAQRILDLEARLAVLEKVEEEARNRKCCVLLTPVISVGCWADFTGDKNVGGYGVTAEKALAALVDGKEGG